MQGRVKMDSRCVTDESGWDILGGIQRLQQQRKNIVQTVVI